MRATRMTIALLVLFGASPAIYGQSHGPFSAVMNNPFIAMFGGPPTPMYVYVDGAEQRVNSPAPGAKEHESDWLIFFGRHERYVISPQQHTCQESIFPASAAPDL